MANRNTSKVSHKAPHPKRSGKAGLPAGMLNIYLSSISNRVNQEVRALTVVAIIFMPATLISGIFGMNFKVMPLLDDPAGFLFALGMMVGVASTLGAVFWHRRWLESSMPSIWVIASPIIPMIREVAP